MHTVTIRYEHPRTGAIKERTFHSEAAMQKWTEKNEVRVTAYSTTPVPAPTPELLALIERARYARNKS